MHIRRSTKWLLALAGVLIAGDAAANVLVARTRAAVYGDVVTPAGTTLEVQDEKLSLACTERDHKPVCSFEAVYTVVNPTAKDESVVAAFFGLRTSGVRVKVNGRIGKQELTTKDNEALDLAVRGHDDEAKRDRGWFYRRGFEADRLDRVGFRLAVAAKQRAEVVVTGEMAPEPSRTAFGSWPPVKVRHAAIANDPAETSFVLEYLVGPIRTWAKAPRITVKITAPSAWTVTADATRRDDAPPAPLPHEVREKDDELQLDFELDGNTVDSLTLDVDVPHERPNRGGLLVAIGGNLDDSGGLRARLGYEFSFPDWALYALHIDSDFSDELVVAPYVGFASPSILVIVPSFGAGIGVPIRIFPEATVGIRLQADLQWPLLGLVATFDIYPAVDADDPLAFQAALMAQFSF